MDNNIIVLIMMTISMSQNVFTIIGPYFIFILSVLFKIRLYRFHSEEICNYITKIEIPLSNKFIKAIRMD